MRLVEVTSALVRWSLAQGLTDMLRRPNALADLEVLHVLSITIDKDLEQIVGSYLALPAHLRRRPLPRSDRTPDQELVRQLHLLDDYVTVTSEQLFRSHTQDIVNLGDSSRAAATTCGWSHRPGDARLDR